MKKSKIALVTMLYFAANGQAGEMFVQEDSVQPTPQTDHAIQRQDINNPEKILLTEKQQNSPDSAYFGRKQDRPISTHKVNYLSFNSLPWNNSAQIKFQISIKYRLLKPDLLSFKEDLLPVYVAYTQMSLWDIGQHSGPFVESNYNPEIFLDYALNTELYGPLYLRNITISPFEHESNGLSTIQSRSWNRQYVMASFGLTTTEHLDETNTFIRDKALLYVKVWRASGYLAMQHYLQSIGNSDGFLDYMGRGEIGVSLRNFLWGGDLKDHQLDIRTPIFRDISKSSYKFEFRQQIPDSNFALYFQYWLGYGESLLRFDQFGHRGFIGFSASN